jgi:regulator of replication initiation timing
MNDLNTKPLCGVKLFPDKSKEFNHSDEEFDEVLEDGLKLNDQVLQLKKQVEVQEQDNMALIERNRDIESENSKLKSMLAKTQVDFLKHGPASESSKVNKYPHHKQHATGCFDEMVQVFGVEAVMAYCRCSAWKHRHDAIQKDKYSEDNIKADWYLKKLSELDAASIFENEPDND